MVYITANFSNDCVFIFVIFVTTICSFGLVYTEFLILIAYNSSFSGWHCRQRNEITVAVYYVSVYFLKLK